MTRIVLAAIATVVVAGLHAGAVAREYKLEGMWVSVTGGTRIDAPRLVEIPKPNEVMTIEHDPATGEIYTSPRNLTAGLLAAGYKLYDPKFIGGLQGDVAVGTVTRPDGPDLCPPLPETRTARLRFRSEAEPRPKLVGVGAQRAEDLRDALRGPLLELLSAIVIFPRSPKCRWDSSGLDENASWPHYYVTTFQRLFLVREVRLLDVAPVSSPGRRMTNIEPGQQFQIEVDFEVPPPAEVEVALATRSGRRTYITIMPTEQPNVFRSKLIKTRERKSE